MDTAAASGLNHADTACDEPRTARVSNAVANEGGPRGSPSFWIGRWA
jgi:hypothetical protein